MDAGAPSAIEGLLRSWTEPPPWQLHVKLLQNLSAADIPERKKAALHRVLMRDLTHPNKFVRAWAYGGLATLARRFPELEKEAGAIFEMALRDESAAVKARIRNAWGKGKAAVPRTQRAL